ncbi:MAG: dihydroorotate dehydrogenase electron transfer subunit [Candidatus Omnitrophota bacterium]|nr:dihydroorotate dehydrogenase electron transfer subunit [Candidatus Omnitrophota bacterium]
MKPKQVTVKVDKIERVKTDVFLLSFVSGYLAKESRPGNFLHIKVNSTILRRPFSVHKVSGNKIYVLFRIRGRGTDILSRYKKGEILDIIGPLGNGFEVRRPKTEDRRLKTGIQNILIAGGIGVAPLMFLAQHFTKTLNTNHQPLITILLGAKNKKEVLCEQELKKLGCKVYVATEDGSKGIKGTVIGLLERSLWTREPGTQTNLYSCGPKEMFWNINQILEGRKDVNCQVSFEQFMGCGLGICCACTIETKNGYKKVCKDGPVFDIRDIW